MPTKRILALSFAALAFLSTRAQSQDPVPLYPKNYKLLFENDRVRVIDFVLKKGDTEDFHSHRPHVAYILTGFKIRFTFLDGRTVIRETKAGDVLFSEAVTHSPLNIGDTDAHGIMVELNERGGKEMGMNGNNSEELLTAVTFIHGLVGKEEEMKDHLLSLTAPTLAEPGCLTYDLYQSPEQKNEFMRFEVWRNDEALELHKMMPHLKASFELRKQQGWTTEITRWRRVRQ